ncbi:MAG: energy-coupling factor ABC transporter permease [Planctomycetes bacterium]|nr:energy-coupling factor ABC transporter permease [Planctomycetota bacterium]
MHIADGVLSNSPSGMIVLGAGAAATVAGTAWALRRMDHEQVPRVALCSAAFFVVSLIHIKLGVAAIHLVFSGLMGISFYFLGTRKK